MFSEYAKLYLLICFLTSRAFHGEKIFSQGVSHENYLVLIDEGTIIKIINGKHLLQ